MDIQKIQDVIRTSGHEGWLFYDFHNRDRLTFRILGLDPGKFMSRRWFYFVPAEGEPCKLVCKVEQSVLDSLPGKREVFLAWTELRAQLKKILGKRSIIAMNYSPMNDIPYASMVDAGTIEMIRELGYDPVSAADLIQQVEAVISPEGFESHIQAGDHILRIKNEAFAKIGEAIRSGEKLSEHEVQEFIMKRFTEEGLTCDGHGPIVGINEHPADPHFEPTPENSYTFGPDQTILIDLWARQNHSEGIYFDVTWCGYSGDNPPAKYVEIFETVRDAREAAVSFVRDKFARREDCFGWEVDDACRQVVIDRGYGDYFIHRTGHSIGTNVHGNGVHIDNLETRDQRQLIPGICFSVEPGIYLSGEMAVRSEINVFITLDSEVVVHGETQHELIRV